MQLRKTLLNKRRRPRDTMCFSDRKKFKSGLAYMRRSWVRSTALKQRARKPKPEWRTSNDIVVMWPGRPSGAFWISVRGSWCRPIACQTPCWSIAYIHLEIFECLSRAFGYRPRALCILSKGLVGVMLRSYLDIVAKAFWGLGLGLSGLLANYHYYINCFCDIRCCHTSHASIHELIHARLYA